MYNIYNSKLEKLTETRERVRADINKMMKKKDYYYNSKLYEKVSALTGLEEYLTFCIEDMEGKIANINSDDEYFM